MENVHELQRPLLGKRAGDKPSFSYVPLSQSQGKTPLDGTRDPTWNQLTQSKSLPRMDAWMVQQLLDAFSLKDAMETVGRPSLALRVEPEALLSLKGCTETTFTESKSAEEQTRNSTQPKDLEPEANLDKVPTVSIDVEDVPFLEMQPNHYIDDESDTDSDSTFSLGIPQDHLGLAIFSMLCCFWPVGIAAFCLSQKISKALNKGNYHEARSASKQALCVAVCSIALGVCTYVGAVVALTIYMSRNGHA